MKTRTEFKEAWGRLLPELKLVGRLYTDLDFFYERKNEARGEKGKGHWPNAEGYASSCWWKGRYRIGYGMLEEDEHGHGCRRMAPRLVFWLEERGFVVTWSGSVHQFIYVTCSE